MIVFKRKEDLQLKQRKLLYSARVGSLAMLLTYGFIYYPNDVNILDEKGFCPLLYVTRRGDVKFIKFLLACGADVNLQNANGITPLHVACERGDANLVITFLDNKGDLNILSNDGLTPLAFASFALIAKLGLQGAVTH